MTSVNDLQTGLYIITNRAIRLALDLDNGSPLPGTKVQGWKPLSDSSYFFNQVWWIEKVGNQDFYIIQNARGGTFVTLKDGNPNDYTPVEGWNDRQDSSQWWYIAHDEDTGYSFENVAGKTVLSLDAPLVGPYPVIGRKDKGDGNQRWTLELRSTTPKEVEEVIKAGQFPVDFTCYTSNTAYVNCPPQVAQSIWFDKLAHKVWRPESYDRHDFAFSMKGAVCDYAYDNLRVPAALLFGVIYAEAAKDDTRAYSWYINDDAKTPLTVMDPVTGKEVDIPGDYKVYLGLY